jgi:hypothetical protein
MRRRVSPHESRAPSSFRLLSGLPLGDGVLPAGSSFLTSFGTTNNPLNHKH